MRELTRWPILISSLILVTIDGLGCRNRFSWLCAFISSFSLIHNRTFTASKHTWPRINHEIRFRPFFMAKNKFSVGFWSMCAPHATHDMTHANTLSSTNSPLLSSAETFMRYQKSRKKSRKQNVNSVAVKSEIKTPKESVSSENDGFLLLLLLSSQMAYAIRAHTITSSSSSCVVYAIRWYMNTEYTYLFRVQVWNSLTFQRHRHMFDRCISTIALINGTKSQAHVRLQIQLCSRTETILTLQREWISAIVRIEMKKKKNGAKEIQS